MNLNLSKLKIVDFQENRTIFGSELLEKINEFQRIFENFEIRKNDVIFIEIPRSAETVLAVLVCIRLQIAFTFSDPTFSKKYEKFKTTLIFDGKEIRRIDWNSENEENLEICYVISTSGTTGIKKQVAVPINCIRRNVLHFCSSFSISQSDSILFSTSLQFDPSIVELFMAFHIGCTLIVVPDEFRSEPTKMQMVIEKMRPTVVQFTPTVFEMLPSPELVLSATSSIRILLIGGSHFPLKFLTSYRSSENKTRIFNVYGVTEISCWATFFEVEIGCSDVFLGETIDGSQLEIQGNGELVIDGPRQCFVNGVKSEKHYTGDRVEKLENGEIRIIGRIDRMIKHRGIRVCLDALEEISIRQNPEIQKSHFLQYSPQTLVQFVVGPSYSKNSIFSSEILKIDETTVIPVTVIHVAQLPLNSSGKIDEKSLIEILENSKIENSKSLKEFLGALLKIDFSKIRDENFLEFGIKSLQAAEISAYFPEDVQNSVIRKILDEKYKIRHFLEEFEDFLDISKIGKFGKFQKIELEARRQPRMRWAVDLKKCIDGNILRVGNLAICASHAGVVVAMNVESGRCVWRTEIPGIRFEATPILVNEEVVIGSKTTGLYFFDLQTGNLNCFLELHPHFGVRSQSTFDGIHVFSITENGVFHQIDPEKKTSISHRKLGKSGGSTSIGPVLAPSPGALFAVLTVGTVTRITVGNTLEFSWQKEFGPIFAEPVFLGNSKIGILNVHGRFVVLNEQTGEALDSIQLENENCFCAPLIIDDSKLLIATKSGSLIYLKMAPKLDISKIFRFDHKNSSGISFVRTPKIRNSKIWMISKNGFLIVGRLQDLDSEAVPRFHYFPMSNREIFTNPEFLENQILIAGRDDFLRSWNFDF